ncbi:YqxA family protein [Bacillus toyonensis]|uniref:YqxA family protein n=1 Tax=Bacillus toyonensis TaxID=155322 RepID=UPI000BEDE6C4|nr:YqxA family protein [Bacillus toyonensis]PEC36676.1 transcriptional regulator [Bacillus toyonensis]PED62705.1 transcriptional regulator [Bacillus toyonensis]PEJ95026.1 transcriptional regulator [Bacillus toyonensis]PEL09089.1 transcriptional regulator [Bacillus toyonensis]PEN35441.1 transcriptional regulator [Bacillus toyonensis]
MRGRDDDSLSRFALLCICSTVLCLLMMIAGVALANHGLKSMKGYQQLSYEQIAHMTGTEGASAESEILGSSFSTIEKQKQLEILRSFNVVEGIGMAIASAAYEITKFGTDIVVGKVKEIFS